MIKSCAVLFRIDIYCGQNEEENTIAKTVVRNLTKALQWQPGKRVVVTDNYYTSVGLSAKLLSLGLYHIGTVRTNRVGWPQISYKFQRRPVRFPRGAYRIAQCKDIPQLVAVSWVDNRPVNFLATGASTHLTSVKRKNKDGTKIDVPCPQLVSDYNAFMGGVDRHDQLRVQRYSLQKSVRFKKYYKALFLGIIDMALVNGFVIHKIVKEKNGESPPTHSQYFLRLQRELLSLQKEDFDRNPHAEDLLSGPVQPAMHSLKKTTDNYRNKLRQYLCKVCSAFSNKDHRSFETSWFCDECSTAFGGKVALCNRVRREDAGNTLTCSQIWHNTWKNGTIIPKDLRKKIRFRKRKRAEVDSN